VCSLSKVQVYFAYAGIAVLINLIKVMGLERIIFDTVSYIFEVKCLGWNECNEMASFIFEDICT